MLLVLIEDSHISWDFDHYELSDVDLHEDEYLMTGTEPITSESQIDPLITIQTKEMLSGVWLMLLVHDEEAGGHS